MRWPWSRRGPIADLNGRAPSPKQSLNAPVTRSTCSGAAPACPGASAAGSSSMWCSQKSHGTRDPASSGYFASESQKRCLKPPLPSEIPIGACAAMCGDGALRSSSAVGSDAQPDSKLLTARANAGTRTTRRRASCMIQFCFVGLSWQERARPERGMNRILAFCSIPGATRRHPDRPRSAPGSVFASIAPGAASRQSET